MNKHVVNALSKYNFNFDGNYGYGFINDYEVNVLNIPANLGPIFFISTFLSQSQKNDFMMKVNALNIKLVKANSFEYGVAVMVGSITGRAFEAKFEETMPKVFEILSYLEAPRKDICPQSGEMLQEYDSRTIVIPDSNIKITLSNNAINTINSYIEKSNEDFVNMPNNYLKGLAGLAIGAIVGVVLMVGFWYLGYVTTLAPLVSIFLGVFLYKNFGGKQNWVMIAMSFVITLIFILGTFVLIYAISARNATLEAGYSFLNFFESLKFSLDNAPEFKRFFFTDLLLNAIFILAAEGISIFSLVKSIKRPKNI